MLDIIIHMQTNIHRYILRPHIHCTYNYWVYMRDAPST